MYECLNSRPEQSSSTLNTIVSSSSFQKIYTDIIASLQLRKIDLDRSPLDLSSNRSLILSHMVAPWLIDSHVRLVDVETKIETKIEIRKLLLLASKHIFMFFNLIFATIIERSYRWIIVLLVIDLYSADQILPSSSHFHT